MAWVGGAQCGSLSGSTFQRSASSSIWEGLSQLRNPTGRRRRRSHGCSARSVRRSSGVGRRPVARSCRAAGAGRYRTGRGRGLVRLVEALQHGGEEPLGCRRSRRPRGVAERGRRRSRPRAPAGSARPPPPALEAERCAPRPTRFVPAALDRLGGSRSSAPGSCRCAARGERRPRARRGRPDRRRASAAGRRSRRSRSHPQNRLRLGDVVAPEHDRVAVIDVPVGPRLAVGAEALLQRRRGGGRAETCVAVHVRGAEPAFPITASV